MFPILIVSPNLFIYSFISSFLYFPISLIHTHTDSSADLQKICGCFKKSQELHSCLWSVVHLYYTQNKLCVHVCIFDIHVHIHDSFPSQSLLCCLIMVCVFVCSWMGWVTKARRICQEYGKVPASSHKLWRSSTCPVKASNYLYWAGIIQDDGGRGRSL